MTRKNLAAALAAMASWAVSPVQGAVLLPGIQGTVSQMGGGPAAGVTLKLFVDDGDAIFEPGAGDSQVGADLMTAADGTYAFGSLDGTGAYFVQRPAQMYGANSLPAEVSGLLLPGEPTLLIDGFDNNQGVKSNPYTPVATSTLNDPLASALGGERDMYVRLESGIGEVELRSNAFGVAVLQYDSTSGVVGHGIITWDGVDMSASPVPSLGLGNLDLTQGGQNEGIIFSLGIDQAGAGEKLKLRLFGDDASIFSEGIVTIPVTDGTASGTAYLPFSDLVGPVSPSQVNAIQLIVGQGAKSVDSQFDRIGAVGPIVQNFEVVPEPSSLLLTLAGLAGVLKMRRRPV
jgi:hypothetical protein